VGGLVAWCDVFVAGVGVGLGVERGADGVICDEVVVVVVSWVGCVFVDSKAPNTGRLSMDIITNPTVTHTFAGRAHLVFAHTNHIRKYGSSRTARIIPHHFLYQGFVLLSVISGVSFSH
jgi:hypothetical protein